MSRGMLYHACLCLPVRDSWPVTYRQFRAVEYCGISGNSGFGPDGVMVVDHVDMIVSHRFMRMRMTVRFRKVAVGMLMIVMRTVTVKMRMSSGLVRMFQHLGILFWPENRRQYREYDHADPQRQRRRPDAKTCTAKPRHQVKNQPAAV